MPMAVETGTWQLDSARSTVALRQKAMWGLVTGKGTFTGVTGAGEVGPDGSVSGSITVRAASLDTKNAKRDKHLHSDDFLAAEQHPEITYTVRGATLGDGTPSEVAGELTVRGTSRPQPVTVRVTESSAEAVVLETEFTVEREQYGIAWNQLGVMRGPTTVTASLRFVRAGS